MWATYSQIRNLELKIARGYLVVCREELRGRLRAIASLKRIETGKGGSGSSLSLPPVASALCRKVDWAN